MNYIFPTLQSTCDECSYEGCEAKQQKSEMDDFSFSVLARFAFIVTGSRVAVISFST